MRYLLALTLFLLPAQDDAKILELIRQLDASSVEERDAAYEQLVKIGAGALAALKKAAESDSSAEVRSRAAEAVRAIDIAEKMKTAYVEPKRVTLKHDGTVRAALEEIGKQAGVKIDVLDAGVDAAVVLDLRNVTLFQALDAVCAGREDCTWEHPDAGVVKMRKEKHVAYPTGCVGPFRIRITSLSVERKSDFKAVTAQVNFGIETDWEKTTKPMGRAKVQFSSAADDAGRALDVKGAEDDAMNALGGIRILRAGGFGMQDEFANRFTAALGADAKGIASLKGTLTVRFPLSSTDVVFDDPTSGDSKDVGDYKIRIKNKIKEGYTLAFTRSKEDDTDLAEEMERRFDTASIIAVDKDGKELKAESVVPQNDGVNIVVVNGKVQQKGGLTYRVHFPDFKGREIKTLKFRFVDQTLEKRFDFELKDTKLP
jgi:hypothetical protein